MPVMSVLTLSTCLLIFVILVVLFSTFWLRILMLAVFFLTFSTSVVTYV